MYLFSRIFLLVFFSALLATDVKSEQGNARDEVVLKDLGIRFIKPSGWFAANSDAIKDNLRKLDGAREDIQRILDSHRGSIALGSYMEKDPRKTPGIIPTINVLGRTNQSQDFAAFRAHIDQSNKALKGILRNYRVITELSEKGIGGRRVVFFVARFDLSLADGTTHEVINITYGIPFDGLFLQISMSEEFPARSTVQFDRFIESFRFQGGAGVWAVLTK